MHRQRQITRRCPLFQKLLRIKTWQYYSVSQRFCISILIFEPKTNGWSFGVGRHTINAILMGVQKSNDFKGCAWGEHSRKSDKMIIWMGLVWLKRRGLLKLLSVISPIAISWLCKHICYNPAIAFISDRYHHNINAITLSRYEHSI